MTVLTHLLPKEGGKGLCSLSFEISNSQRRSLNVRLEGFGYMSIKTWVEPLSGS